MQQNVTDGLRDTAFGMVADAQTRLLVLGSLPGRQSLAAGCYYAHPRNQFWRLLSPVVGADLMAMDYPARLSALLKAGIGLWDVVESARRRGSLDADLRDVEARDLRGAAARLPALRAMAFNGAKAFGIGRAQLGDAWPLIALPSSSPAHAVGIAAKQPAWAALREWL
ncbi:DNA-deoxyinosine glycosylase [Novosphingobium sp. KACC 22771]|uniref:DNA-deoxyinosine glycosylase n=1 Tax=Novosphingobium sp. KACC 22771 TaxID=3025670 RepID=UPI0023665374|nr:DNA-deoxyinosine glycosylase [Novosphingobium sp. KACC 22771]WDF73189.1 DNA-deoxyinosine glycosylase [Novosphingobium sp. KACC 22771]